MRRIPVALVLVALVAIPGRAAADPYTILPDGSVVFNTTMSTSGTFSFCAATTTCAGLGTNSVVMGTGADAISITFNGTSSSFAVGNVAMPVSLGTFTVSSADPAAVFPSSGNVFVPLIGFNLAITHTEPAAGTSTRAFGLGSGGGTTLPVLLAGGDYLTLPLGVNPPGMRYTAIVYSIRPFPFRLEMNRVSALTADVGVIPEPTTLLLVGSGLVFGFAGRRRLRRRSEGEGPSD